VTPTDAELISPERAEMIRSLAPTYAARIIEVQATEWDPLTYVDNVETEAEAELLREAVQDIARKIRLQAMVGTSQTCSVCRRPYTVKANGTVWSHDGISRGGYSSGEPCPGAGLEPAI
jgi:hypothetical protein